MSALQARIQEELKAAMKAKAEVELQTLRLLKSDIQYEMSKDGSSELSDEAVMGIIRRNIKKRKESIEQYEKGGRPDQAKAERDELVILERYLPAAVSQEDIKKAIEDAVLEMKPAPGDVGKVTGRVMGKFKGQNIDGALVKELVSARLQN